MEQRTNPGCFCGDQMWPRVYPSSGADYDDWDDEWDDAKSTGGYAESESGEGGAVQRAGAHAPSMKISLNK